MILSATHLNAQGFEGVWRGSFNIVHGIQWCPINLLFKWNKDSTYDIFSFSQGKTIQGADTTVACAVEMWVKSFDVIILQEYAIIEPLKYQHSCLQKMKLKLIKRKDKIFLRGTWDDNCATSGTVRFEKIE